MGCRPVTFMHHELTTYLEYRCRRQRPAIRVLLLGGTAMLLFTIVLGDLADPPDISVWVRIVPVMAMALISAAVWRPISDESLQLATLAHTIAMCAGLLIDGMSRRHGILFAAPTLIVAGVASSMIWVNGTLLVIGESLTAATMVAVLSRGGIPAWLQLHATIFMAVSIAAGCLLYLVTSRLLYDNFRLEAQLRRSAFTDELTGLANRRRIMQVAKRVFQRCQVGGQPFSVLYVDADRFKRINDEHGHAVGDSVLCHVARTIEAVVRSTDQVGRVGGEEFIVLLPGLAQIDAVDVAERIRRAMEGTATHGLTVTVSIGVATSVNGCDFRMVLNAADASVLMAKRNGRNRIEVALQAGRELATSNGVSLRYFWPAADGG